MFTKNTSLIIPTCDRPQYLKKILNFLLKNKIIFKKIIIIDSSLQHNKNKIQNICAPLKVKLIFSKKSTSIQRNVGILNSLNTKFIMFLDDDIVFFKNAFFEMNKAIKKYKNFDGFCFNIIEKKNENLFNFIKNTKLIKFFKIYSDAKGIVLSNGWHTQLINLKKDTQVEWMYSGATIYKKKAIKNKFFKVDSTPYCYLEDLDFSYNLYLNKKKFICVYNAKILNPNQTRRDNFNFGKQEIINRYQFVKKNRLNFFMFYITCILKITLNFFKILQCNFKIIFRIIGNIIGLFLTFKIT